MPEVIGEYVDRLCTIEMRPDWRSTSRRGMMSSPLRRSALARRLRSRSRLPWPKALVEPVGAGDNVFILTGAGGPPVLPEGEVDGLLGAAALARELTLTLAPTSPS